MIILLLWRRFVITRAKKADSRCETHSSLHSTSPEVQSIVSAEPQSLPPFSPHSLGHKWDCIRDSINPGSKQAHLGWGCCWLKVLLHCQTVQAMRCFVNGCTQFRAPRRKHWHPFLPPPSINSLVSLGMLSLVCILSNFAQLNLGICQHGVFRVLF